MELVTDPAHLAYEVLTTALIEGLILGLLWPLIKRRIRREVEAEHTVLDIEHGVEAHGVVVPAEGSGVSRAS